MRNGPNHLINDINDCVRQARTLMKSEQNIHQKDQSLFQAFIALTGDETTGILAFAIWRERAHLIASLRNYINRGPEVLTNVRASLTST